MAATNTDEEDKKKAKEKKGKDPFNFLLSGKVLTHKIDTHRGVFTLKFPLPSDLREIECKLADMLDGRPASAFTDRALADMKAYATLDTGVIDSPNWWKKLDLAEQCPDDSLVKKLYRGYLRHYLKVQKALSSDESGSDVGDDVVGDSTESMDDASFSGITHGQ